MRSAKVNQDRGSQEAKEMGMGFGSVYKVATPIRGGDALKG